jgi:phosphoglycolate phosphatase
MTCLAFDIDGTLFDCSDIIIDAFQKGIALFNKSDKRKVQIPSKEKIISVLGIPTDTIYQNLFPDLNAHDQQKMNDLCSNTLIDMIYQGAGSLYEHVYSTLERLYKEDCVIYVASNGKLRYIESILESNDIMKFFKKPIVVLDSNIKSKSDIVRYYKTNICKNDLFIMVGDRTTDRLAAEENNIPFIGCAFGHAGFSELEGVRWTATDFKKIYDSVKDIERIYNTQK